MFSHSSVRPGDTLSSFDMCHADPLLPARQLARAGFAWAQGLTRLYFSSPAAGSAAPGPLLPARQRTRTAGSQSVLGKVRLGPRPLVPDLVALSSSFSARGMVNLATDLSIYNHGIRCKGVTPDSSLSIRSMFIFGSAFSTCNALRVEELMPASDLLNMGSALPPRSFAWTGLKLLASDLLHPGSSTPPQGLARSGSAAAALSFGFLEASPSSQSCRQGSPPSVLGSRLGSPASVPESATLEPSSLLRSSARAELPTSAPGRSSLGSSSPSQSHVRTGASLPSRGALKPDSTASALDFTSLGSLPLPRHPACGGLSTSPVGLLRMGTFLMFPDFLQLEASSFLHSAAHPESSLPAFHNLQPEPSPSLRAVSRCEASLFPLARARLGSLSVVSFGTLEMPLPTQSLLHADASTSAPGVAWCPALPVLDSLSPGSTTFPRSFAWAGSVSPAMSSADTGTSSLLRSPSQLDATPSLCGLQRLGLSSAALDFGTWGSSLALRSLVQLDVALLALGGVRLDPAMLALDCCSSGPMPLPRGPLCSGQFLELEKLKKWSIISLEISDYYRGEVSLPVRSSARSELVLPSCGSGCADPFMSAMDPARLDSSLPLRSCACPDPFASLLGLARSGDGLPALDLLNLEPLLPPRSLVCSGLPAAALGWAALDPLPFAQSSAQPDSSALLLGILRLEVLPSVFGVPGTGASLPMRAPAHLELATFASKAVQLGSPMLPRSSTQLGLSAPVLHSARVESSLLALDFLRLGAPSPLQSLGRLEPATPALNTARIGVPPPLKQPARPGLLLLLPSRATSGSTLAALDVFESDSASLPRSKAYLGLALATWTSLRLGTSPSVTDFGGLGLPLLLRSLSQTGMLLLATGISRPGPSVPASDSLHLESLILLRSPIRAGLASPTKLHRVGLPVPVTDSKLPGPALLLRALAQVGLPPLASGGCVGRLLLAPDFLCPGASLPPRSFSRAGSAAPASNVHLESFSSLRSSGHPGLAFSPVRRATSGLNLVVPDSAKLGPPPLVRQSARPGLPLSLVRAAVLGSSLTASELSSVGSLLLLRRLSCLDSFPSAIYALRLEVPLSAPDSSQPDVPLPLQQYACAGSAPPACGLSRIPLLPVTDLTQLDSFLSLHDIGWPGLALMPFGCVCFDAFPVALDLLYPGTSSPSHHLSCMDFAFVARGLARLGMGLPALDSAGPDSPLTARSAGSPESLPPIFGGFRLGLPSPVPDRGSLGSTLAPWLQTSA